LLGALSFGTPGSGCLAEVGVESGSVGWRGYAGGEKKSQSACGEENEGGGFGDGGWSCFRGDGEVVVVGAFDGVGEVDQRIGAGDDGGGVEVAGGGDEGDEEGTGEGDAVEGKAIACVVKIREEGDIEGFAAESVDGSGGSEGRDGNEVGRVSEGELFGQGESVAAVIAGDGEKICGVGVGGAGEDQGGGEERECEESFAHGGIPFSN
jgi:hypothetical protein